MLGALVIVVPVSFRGLLPIDRDLLFEPDRLLLIRKLRPNGGIYAYLTSANIITVIV